MADVTRSCLIACCFMFLCSVPASTDDEAYSKSLLKFKESLTNVTMLDDWREPVANLCAPIWTGCLCLKGVVRGLKLEGMGLGGKINVRSISNLPLYSFSVMNNNIAGLFPSDINKLRNIRQLYLANNSFSGEIPDDAFSGMKAMKRVILGNNDFSGNIPKSLLELPNLVDLQLQNNRFEGQIPDFRQKNLTVNLSYNKLEGPIPEMLRNQNASSFFGNNNLCGKPLDECKPKKSKTKTALIVVVTMAVALAAIISIFLILCKHSRMLNCKKSVDKSPAEVLGSGSFGSSYKAVLSSGSSYVVRRFRHMSIVGKQEFYEHIRRLGRLSHPNLLPLVAFERVKTGDGHRLGAA